MNKGGNLQLHVDVLAGLLFVNNKDVYRQYGAFLTEERAGDNKNYAELMKPADAKPHQAVNFREQDGEKLPDVLTPAFEARDVTLQFAIVGKDRDEFLARYNAFLGLLRNGDKGWLQVTVPELKRTFRMYYLSCTGWKQLTDFNGEVVARFSVKLREPRPHQPYYVEMVDNEIETLP